MTNQEILRIALAQSAADANCAPEDFLKNEPVFVPAGLTDKARKYLKPPMMCNFITYGNNVVVSVAEPLRPLAEAYVKKYEFYECFETPQLLWLNERLRPQGLAVCFMAEYYLPDVNKMHGKVCPYPTKILHQEDFRNLYRPEWSNALCANRRELDILGIGAYDGDKLVGLAACSADCDSMWQIGIDVLPDYRRQGIAAALTENLAIRILKQGKVPFYCSAWSNVRSVRNAVKSGFIPAWMEMTVKPISVVNDFLN